MDKAATLHTEMLQKHGMEGCGTEIYKSEKKKVNLKENIISNSFSNHQNNLGMGESAAYVTWTVYGIVRVATTMFQRSKK